MEKNIVIAEKAITDRNRMAFTLQIILENLRNLFNFN